MRKEDKKDVDQWIDELHSDDRETQRAAIKKLGESREQRAVKPLVDLLDRTLGKYNERFLTSSIVEALGKLGTREAGHALLRALDSDYFFIKEAAAEALTETPVQKQAVTKLEEAVQEDAPENVKKSAVKALGKKGRTKAVRPLSDVAEKEDDPHVKAEAIKALGETGTPEAAAPLMSLYTQEADAKLKQDIIMALASIGTVGSAEFLIKALQEKNPQIRSCAALALGESGSEIAELPLKNLLTDPSEMIRKSAAQALGIITFLPDQE